MAYLLQNKIFLTNITKLGETSVPNEVLTGIYFGTTASGYSLSNPNVEMGEGSLLLGSVTGEDGASLNSQYGFRSGFE